MTAVTPPPDDAWPENTPLLHVIAQGLWHSPAFVGGNRAGIEALRDACNAALAATQTTEARVFCRDGEGYRVVVRVLDQAEAAAMPFGYTDEVVCQNERWADWMTAWAG